MKVVVNVGSIFLGKGKDARRYKRDDIVEISDKKVPKWAVSLDAAMKKEAAKAPEPEEPKTLSEMGRLAEGKKQQAFGQDV